MSLFLAIDAGGTKTECLIADGAVVLARASTGTVKLMRVTEEEATARLRAMLEEVAASAGAALGQVTRTCLGMAGLTSPVVRAWARQAVPGLVAGELLLCGDEEIALDAAFRGGVGILVVAGTGSNVVGRAADDELVGCGGWGPVLGDEGSGSWIGLEAIRAALRAQDRIGFGGAPTCLLREIERHWKLNSLEELVALANRHPGPDYAGLAPVVARCAEAGDSLAAGVLERAGEELAEQVGLVCQKMAHSQRSSDPASPESQEIAVAFTGSVLSNIAAVRNAMVARLAVSHPNVRVRESPVDPLEGALWRARQG
jgi:glucosamine kinase